MKDDGIKNLEHKLKSKFKNISLLQNALVHRSYINERQGSGLKSNERMEFLGDAVLSAVVSNMLITKFPNMDEGGLSKLRARLVNESTLSSIARELHIGQHVLLGRGEEITGGREKPSILADAYEAVVAAIYLDSGFNKTFRFVASHFEKLLDEFPASETSKDYKTEFQEYVQDIFKTSPKYCLVKESGPEHDKIFEVKVLIKGENFGKGIGRSKKEAEQDAAKDAMERLKTKGYYEA
ncbi:MAG: ribonuclease III [Deltaproteobacteria bacterium]|nr:ribonuclease III [Deltaproteobacteria bacterium]